MKANSSNYKNNHESYVCYQIWWLSLKIFFVVHSKQVNAQVFEIASKLEETPLLGSPIQNTPTVPLQISPTNEDDSLEGAKPYTDDDINEVCSFAYISSFHFCFVILFIVGDSCFVIQSCLC